jgi:hypothetical protein
VCVCFVSAKCATCADGVGEYGNIIQHI